MALTATDEIDIENPGADEAELAAALQTLVNVRLLDPAVFEGSIAVGNGLGAAEWAAGTQGYWNTTVGIDAGLNLTNQWACTFVGFNAGKTFAEGVGPSSTGVFGNTAIGYNSFTVNVEGYDNTAVGVNTLLNNDDGNDNSAFGINALRNNRGGYDNTAIGYDSLMNISEGYQLTALGGMAGRFLSDGATEKLLGNNSIYIGWQAFGGAVDDVTNEIVIGALATGGGANTLTLGNISNLSTRLYGDLLIRTGSAGATARFSQIQLERPGIGSWTFGNPVAGGTSNSCAINLNGTTALIIGTGRNVTAGSAEGTSTLESSGSFGAAIATVSANTTLSNAHHTVLVDATAASRTITLPAASGCARRIYIIKKIDASANTVTIDGNASETIDGATTRVLTTQWETVRIQSNGTAWFVI